MATTFVHHKLQRIRILLALGVLLGSPFAAAQPTYDIGSPSTGGFAAVGAFMQEFVDFLGGPGVMFVTFISIGLGVILWTIAPKAQGVMSWIIRAVAGSIVLLNLPLWITYFQGL